MKTNLIRLVSLLWAMAAALLSPHSAIGQEDVARIIQHSSEANERD